MNKTPYAYSVSYYDEKEIFPTIDLAVEYLKRNHFLPQFLVEESLVWAHFADQESQRVDLKDFIKTNNIDKKEVADYIDGRIRASLEEERRTLEAIKNGAPSVLVTGSAPIHLLNRDDLIKREINARKYSWK